MARNASIVVIITLVCLSAGCRLDTGGSRLMPTRTSSSIATTGPIDLGNVSESDLAEQVALTRQEYLQAIELLVNFYAGQGDNQKLSWARKEMEGLKKLPWYGYLGDVIPGPELKARIKSPAADALYIEGETLYNEATKLVIYKKKGQLRIAMDKLKQVIHSYPTSDRIDDAAFHLGVIYEYFKDYSIASTYYQRAYQWDERTPWPARFKAASLLDNYLNKRDEALELYQKAIVAEGTMHPAWKEHAEKRLPVLTGTNQ